MRSMVEGAGRLHGNPVGNPRGIVQDFGGRYPKHVQAQISHSCVSRLIAIRTVGAVMRRSIHLDHKRRFAAEKIRDIGFDRMLAAKFQTAGSKTKLLPEEHLRQRHFAAEAARRVYGRAL